MQIIREAHRYADAGLYVIPIRERDKRPAIKTGPEHMTAATISHGVIDAWWTAHPEWNVAIVCSPSKLVVVDIDGPEGEDTLNELVAMYGEPPATWEAHTARGRHLLYRWPEGRRIRTTVAGPKLDIRGAGSYIVAPPSIHPSGDTYTWTETEGPIAVAPHWLIAGRADQPAAEHRTERDGFHKGLPLDMVADIWDTAYERLRFAGLTEAAAALRAYR